MYTIDCDVLELVETGLIKIITKIVNKGRNFPEPRRKTLSKSPLISQSGGGGGVENPFLKPIFYKASPTGRGLNLFLSSSLQ